MKTHTKNVRWTQTRIVQKFLQVLCFVSFLFSSGVLRTAQHATSSLSPTSHTPHPTHTTAHTHTPHSHTHPTPHTTPPHPTTPYHTTPSPPHTHRTCKCGQAGSIEGSSSSGSKSSAWGGSDRNKLACRRES